MKNIILFTSLILNVIVCIAQQEKRFRYPETVELQAAEYVAPPIYDLEFFKTETYGNALDPEEVWNIDLKIKNRGDGPGENINIEVSTKDPITGLKINYPTTTFDIAPGHSVIQRITLTGEINLEQKESNLEIKLTESRGLAPSIPLIPIKTARFKEPKIILVDAQFATEDQKSIKKGKNITITAVLKNDGEGKAENISLDINYHPSIFAVDGISRPITSLLPGEPVKKAFTFIAPSKFNEDSIIVTLTASERFSKYGFQTKVGVPINSKSAAVDLSNLLSSEEEVEEVVFDDVKLESDVDVDVPITSIKRPNALAVVIGNRDYNKTENVKYAINDSRSIRNYLIQAMGFDENNIIYKENASFTDFNEIFGNSNSFKGYLYDRSRRDIDEVFIYYSGHGAPDINSDSKKPTGYFVPIDCNPNNVKLSGYSSKVFFDNLNKLEIDNTTVVLDACFSGGSGSNSGEGNIIKNVSSVRRLPKEITNLENGILMASSTGKQVSSWHVNERHGLFTYYFLKSIQNNRDRKLTFREAFDYIEKQVPDMARYLNKIDQNPTIKGTEIAKSNILFQKQ